MSVLRGRRRPHPLGHAAPLAVGHDAGAHAERAEGERPRSSAGRLDESIGRAVEHLLSLQSPDGYWWAELEANVTMAAEHIFLERFLGIGDEQRTRKLQRYILSKQSEDGSWPIYAGGPGDVSVTTEAYFALKLSGIDPLTEEMARARLFVRAHGGVARTRIFTRLWLSLFGQSDWAAWPIMPPEVVLFPSWFPFNIYEFASWARGTIVAVLVVWAYKPVIEIRPEEAIPELYLEPGDRSVIHFRTGDNRWSWRTAFLAVDRLMRLTERLPWKPFRGHALAACERWILEHQEADGSWCGIQPPWVYSLIALKCRGFANDHPVMKKGIEGLLTSFALEDGETFTVQPCLSPVWDTALAVTGLREAGLPADHPALVQAGKWLLSEEIRTQGDWCVKVRNVEPGGWPFEFVNDKYPDTDDTAEVLIALRLINLGDGAQEVAGRATRWLRAMQSRNGGWGAFDRDNTRTFVTQIPFADFGATLDPPTEDVTAHILEWLMLDGARTNDAAVRRAVSYLHATQDDDGSWFGRWGVNYIYGTGAALPALVLAGERSDSPRVRTAVDWLLAHQNRDGGWGESCASYEDPTWKGRGVSTASQTAWALLALLAAGEAASDAVARGIGYLVEAQLPDGRWAEDEFTGTGFPRDFMLNYHLYRNYWPLWALGRYRRILAGAPIHLPGSNPWS